MINSKRKGARGEIQWRNVLLAHGWDARRGQQFSGSPDSPDVVCEELPIHWEVKFTEKLRLYDAIDQARGECGDKWPVVAHRKNNWPWYVTLDANLFLDILRLVDFEELRPS